MNKTSSKVFLVFKWVVLILVLLALYLPLLMIVLYSFSASRTVGGDLGGFTFVLYKNLFSNTKLLTALKNTMIIGLTSAALATLLGTTAAVGIHYMKRKMKAVSDTASQITVVNAEIVTAMGFFLLMIFLRDTVHLPINFSIGWLILTHTVITTPYVILTVAPRLKQLN
ncbi:MAG: hypothetical protein J6U39_01760, partial [Clostridia bacterium]|nr:hypothetical protein [Clostridia bacterium]